MGEWHRGRNLAKAREVGSVESVGNIKRLHAYIIRLTPSHTASCRWWEELPKVRGPRLKRIVAAVRAKLVIAEKRAPFLDRYVRALPDVTFRRVGAKERGGLVLRREARGSAGAARERHRGW